MRRILIASLFLFAAPFLSTGCADLQEFDNCVQICDRYQECVDSDYDVSSCIDRCETESDKSASYAQSANECEACLDNRSCGESWPCTLECGTVVP